MLYDERKSEQSEALDDHVDEFCYQLALVLRRILNLDENDIRDDEDTDDWRRNPQRGFGS